MIFSLDLDEDLMVPDNERDLYKHNTETAIIVRIPDLFESIFDLNEYGLYLYSSDYPLDPSLSISPKIIGVDVI